MTTNFKKFCLFNISLKSKKVYQRATKNCQKIEKKSEIFKRKLW